MHYVVSETQTPDNKTRVCLYAKRAKSKSLLEKAAECLEVDVSEVSALAASAPDSSPPLDFSGEFRTVPIKCSAMSYPRTVFGRNAMARLMQAGGAMDRLDSAPTNYLFLTATLPGDDFWAKWGIAKESGYIIDTLKSWLSKRIQNRLEFYVWEHQERGALHLHYCLYVPDPSHREWIKNSFRDEWIRLLDKASDNCGHSLWGKYVDCSYERKYAILQTRVEIVYSSVCAYMAGYFSDGTSKHGNDKKHPFYPKRWWGVSRPLSEAIKDMTRERETEFTSLKQAREFTSKRSEEYLDDVLTHKEFPHKVGIGRTHIFYHLPQQQETLWNSTQMLTHPKTHHPNIWFLTQEIKGITQTGRSLAERFPNFRAKLCRDFFGYWEDSTFSVSLTRGAISQTHVREMLEAYSRYDWSSDSQYAIKSWYKRLQRVNLLISHYQPQFQWNQYGWLKNDSDFSGSVDEIVKNEYTRTSTEDTSTGHDAANLVPPKGHTDQPCPSLTQISQHHQLPLI